MKPFAIKEGDGINGRLIAEKLVANIILIQQTHSEKALTGAGYISSVHDLNHVNEDISDKNKAFLPVTALNPFADIFSKLAEIIWPHIEIEGELLK